MFTKGALDIVEVLHVGEMKQIQIAIVSYTEEFQFLITLFLIISFEKLIFMKTYSRK